MTDTFRVETSVTVGADVGESRPVSSDFGGDVMSLEEPSFKHPSAACTAVTISAVAHADIEIHDADGQPLTLAAIDAAGNIVASGPDLVRDLRGVSVNCYRNYLRGQGWLRTLNTSANDAQVAA